jgi:hypothetical protein
MPGRAMDMPARAASAHELRIASCFVPGWNSCCAGALLRHERPRCYQNLWNLLIELVDDHARVECIYQIAEETRVSMLFWMSIILWSAMCKVVNDDTRA